MGRLIKDERKKQLAEKYRRERDFLNRLFEVMGVKCIEKNIVKSESPDFIVTLPGRKIGVEITEFYSDPDPKTSFPRVKVEQAWASLQKKIMDEVKKYTELENTSGLLFFKKVCVPNNIEHESFIREIVQLAVSMINSSTTDVKKMEKYPILNAYLERFLLTKVNCYINWEWNHSVSSVGVTEKELCQIVDKKIQKGEVYSESVEELWLLIASGDKLSQSMGIISVKELNSFSKLNILLNKSKFNYVYIYQSLFGRVFKWPGWTQIN